MSKRNRMQTVLRCLIVLCPLLAGACAAPIPFQIASWTADGISYLATRKSVTDHGLSVIVGQDCALLRGLTEGAVCRDEADALGAIATAAGPGASPTQQSAERLATLDAALEAEYALDSSNPALAARLNNLALAYQADGDFASAESAYNRSLAIWERTLGPNHQDLAMGLDNLASLYQIQGRYAEAEPLHRRALDIFEQSLGTRHLQVALTLNNLASLQGAQGRYGDSETLNKRALVILKDNLGPKHPDVAASLHNLARLYVAQARYDEAEPLYKLSLRIWTRALGSDDAKVAESRRSYAALLKKTGRGAKAERMDGSSRGDIVERAPDDGTPDHS